MSQEAPSSEKTRTEASLEEAHETLVVLGQKFAKFHDIVSRQLQVNSVGSGAENDAISHVWTQLNTPRHTHPFEKRPGQISPLPGIHNQECSVVFSTHESEPGAFYLVSDGRTIRINTPNSGCNFLYLDNGVSIAKVASDQPAKMTRINGKIIDSMDEQGVHVNTGKQVTSYRHEVANYERLLEIYEARMGIGNRILDYITGVDTPSKPFTPTRPEPIVFPHQELVDVARVMIDGLQKAVALLESALSRARSVRGITEVL